MNNELLPKGWWEPYGAEEDPESWLYFQTRGGSFITIFGMDFHMMAIAVTDGEIQDAVSKADQHNLEALHEAGGSDSG